MTANRGACLVCESWGRDSERCVESCPFGWPCHSATTFLTAETTPCLKTSSLTKKVSAALCVFELWSSVRACNKKPAQPKGKQTTKREERREAYSYPSMTLDTSTYGKILQHNFIAGFHTRLESMVMSTHAPIWSSYSQGKHESTAGDLPAKCGEWGSTLLLSIYLVLTRAANLRLD